MGLFEFLKKIINHNEKSFSEFLFQQKRKMTPREYFKFLKKQLTLLNAELAEREVKGLDLPESLINKIKMVEKETEETGTLIGEKISWKKDRVSQSIEKEEDEFLK
jgi:hypothetical protein